MSVGSGIGVGWGVTDELGAIEELLAMEVVDETTAFEGVTVAANEGVTVAANGTLDADDPL